MVSSNDPSCKSYSCEKQEQRIIFDEDKEAKKKFLAELVSNVMKVSMFASIIKMRLLVL